MFKLCKAYHHRQVLKTFPKKFLFNIYHHFKSITAAFSTPTLRNSIKDSFTLCYETVHLQLLEHYDDCLTESFDLLTSELKTVPENVFLNSLRIVYTWMSNQLKHKFTENTWNDCLDMLHHIRKISNNVHSTRAQPVPFQSNNNNSETSNSRQSFNQISTQTDSALTHNIFELLDDELDFVVSNEEPQQPASPPVSHPAHAPPTKENNTRRFFVHAQTHDEDTTAASLSQPVTHTVCSQPTCAVSTMVLASVETSSQPVIGPSISRSACNLSAVAEAVEQSPATCIVLGDNNWTGFNSNCEPFVFSGKLSALRLILAKIKKAPPNLKTFICAISSNNIEANYDKTVKPILPTTLKLINQLFGHVKVFIVLPPVNIKLSNNEKDMLNNLVNDIKKTRHGFNFITSVPNATFNSTHVLDNNSKDLLFKHVTSFLASVTLV